MTGPSVFRKARAGAPSGFFACEAAGLRWLRVPGGPRVVGVVAVAADHLDLERLAESRPTRHAAVALGRALAALHTAGAPAWGSPPDAWLGDAFFGPLDDPLVLPTGAWPTWHAFYAEARLRTIAAQGAARSALDRAEQDRLRRLADEVEAAGRRSGPDDRRPDRVHGDLWSGNVLWTADGATLIDPAAHGGDGEADLAMLALFGAPHLDAVLAGYDAVRPPRPGRARRVRLQQVYPVAVHAVLFGGGYHARLAGLLDDLLG